MSGRLKLAAAVMAVAGVAGASWFRVYRLRASRPQVWTEVVNQRDVTATLTGRGWLRRARGTTLSSPADGRVRSVLVGANQMVHGGQPLVLLEDRPARLGLDHAINGVAAAAAELRRAEADVDRLGAARGQAWLAHRRAQQLLDAGLTAREFVDRSRHDARQAELAHSSGVEALQAARARARGAEAARLDAELRLSNLTVRAPLAGVVTSVFVRQDQPVHGGGTHAAATRLLTIGETDVTDVDVSMDARDAERLWPGFRASVTIPALRADALAAQVISVADRDPAGAAAGVAVIRVRLDDAPVHLREGMSAVVEFTAAARARAIAVPNHAVAAGTSRRAAVWTIRGGVIALVPVVLGLRGAFYSEVLAGASPGLVVVTGPIAVVATLGVGDRAIAVPSPVRMP